MPPQPTRSQCSPIPIPPGRDTQIGWPIGCRERMADFGSLHRTTDRLPDRNPDRIPDRILDRIVDGIPDRIPDGGPIPPVRISRRSDPGSRIGSGCGPWQPDPMLPNVAKRRPKQPNAAECSNAGQRYIAHCSPMHSIQFSPMQTSASQLSQSFPGTVPDFPNAVECGPKQPT